jgi:type IV pilus assembly protein PilC
MVVIFFALLIFVVPTFKNLFASLGAKLPWPTRAVLYVSHLILSWRIIPVLVVVAGIVIGFVYWKKSESGHATWDRFKLRPPVFGPLLHKVAMARFASTLSSLVSSGVPILESLDIVTETVGNVSIGTVLQGAKQAVREGRPLADSLSQGGDLIPSLVVQMIEVGEQTGALDGMLLKVAEYYDNEVDTTVNNLTSLLEPMLTVVMGIGVGSMVIAMYLPMLTYIKHIPTG